MKQYKTLYYRRYTPLYAAICLALLFFIFLPYFPNDIRLHVHYPFGSFTSIEDMLIRIIQKIQDNAIMTVALVIGLYFFWQAILRSMGKMPTQKLTFPIDIWAQEHGLRLVNWQRASIQENLNMRKKYHQAIYRVTMEDENKTRNSGILLWGGFGNLAKVEMVWDAVSNRMIPEKDPTEAFDLIFFFTPLLLLAILVLRTLLNLPSAPLAL